MIMDTKAAVLSAMLTHRLRVASLLLVAALWALNATASHAGAGREAEAQTEIRQLLDAVEAAWKDGSLDGFMTLYHNSPDTTYVTPGGLVRGYDAIRTMLHDDFGLGKGEAKGWMKFNILDFRLLRRDLAYVATSYTLVLPSGSGGEMRGHASLILKKTKDGWKTIADHAG
ncbi:MAG: SgcJ/EcaC family oxidoreductase [Sphingomonadales bacterium]|nr:SgcJ/EcaC family oxidoreductase [Sphingomonadales bacterium]RIK94981.1 MAG: hypothetical protein DCC73_00935 [Pseudomonadota bacterium]